MRGHRPIGMARSVVMIVAGLLCTSGFLVVTSPVASATTPVTLYVDNASTATVTAGCAVATNPCLSIQAGVSAAEALTASTVTLDVAGSSTPYDEQVTINVPSSDSLDIVGTGNTLPIVDDGATGTDITIEGGNVTINGLAITDGGGNSTAFGGGVHVEGGIVTLTDDTLSENAVFTGSAPGIGGGVYNESTLTMTNDTLSDDTSSYGGGGVYNQGTLTMTNDTLSDDTSSYEGGGVENVATLTMTNDTLSDDTAPLGGGVDNLDGTAMIANSILSDASCVDSVGTVTDGGYNDDSTTSCFGATSPTAAGSLTGNTSIGLAASLGANGSSGPQTLAITSSSSAFELVPAAACTVTTDERGELRPGYSEQNCDAGAFELQPSATTPVTLYVDNASTATVTAGCAVATNPCLSIQAGVSAAEALTASTVTLDVAGSSTPYDEQVTINVPSSDSLDIEGTGTTLPTVDDGASGTDITIARGNVTISGLTITDGGGASTSTGGGVLVDGGTVTLTDDTISEDAANSSEDIGPGTEEPTGYGGGVFNDGSLTMTDDTLTDDTASNKGGGVYNDGSLTMTNDTLSDDTASFGGGVDNSDSLTMTNDTLSDDTGGEGANPSQGGIVNSDGTTTIANSILSATACSDLLGTVIDGGYNDDSTTSCFGATSPTAAGSLTGNTSIGLAASLSANGSSGPQTLAITSSSSAFELVPAAACTVTTDERGELRPGYSEQNCDAGAFELQPSGLPPAFTSAASTTFGYGVAGSFAVTTTGMPNVTSITNAGFTGCVPSTLPAGVTFTYTSGTSATIASATSAPAGIYTLCLNAANGVAPDATQSLTLTIAPAPQAIAFTSSPINPADGGTYTVTATGGASGNAVTFAAAAMSVCTVSGSTVTFTGVGTCTILANQAGDTDYLPAPQVSQGITVSKATTKLVVAPVSVVWSLLTLGVTFSGTLTSGVTATGVAGQLVTFSDGGLTSCSATTNAKGVASCSVSVLSVLVLLLSPTFSAVYAGSTDYGASSATGTSTLL